MFPSSWQSVASFFGKKLLFLKSNKFVSFTVAGLSMGWNWQKCFQSVAGLSMGWNWQKCFQSGVISIFRPIFFVNYIFELFQQGLNWRCYVIRWFLDWIVSFFFVFRIGILMGRKNEKILINSKFFRFSLSDFSKATGWNASMKVCIDIFLLSEIFYYSSHLYVWSIISAPIWRKMSQCNCASCSRFMFDLKWT